VAVLIDVILRIGLIAATGFLFAIILLSYLRIRNARLLFIAIGFGIFFIHALLYMPEIMFQSFTIEFTENLHIALNLLALILIAVGIIRE
jgi:hypothetical protein